MWILQWEYIILIINTGYDLNIIQYNINVVMLLFDVYFNLEIVCGNDNMVITIASACAYLELC